VVFEEESQRESERKTLEAKTNDNTSSSKYILFAGREVRIEKNCARGLEYGPRPQAEGRAQDRGHSFSQYGPTKAGK